MQSYKVQGMTCGHCERAVIQAIQSRDPAAEVRVDLAAGLVQVQSALPEQAVREAITEEGFQVHS
ncbi:heavy-metal-associated domain-containing protein [Stutzerimonas tarimensis]|uniref:Heavy-metal-associated domain-containing protein n=1 Tax=Stutzerimonas tarimensis TaxID=1507735 RepID=A0ABV7T3T5_9GAMM